MMNNGMPYVIALYIRLSVEDSKTGSLSIENQRYMLHQYVDSMEELKNVEVLDFIDNGYSGTNFERPAVQKLLDMVREGKINCIIVKDFTRFGRNSLEVGYFLERVFPLFHIRFISVGDGFDSNDYRGDTGGISIAIQFLAGELYSRDLSMKYKSAKYVKFRRGEYQSEICPYGYRKSADGRMEPDAETAPNVQLIFELAVKSRHAGEIAKALFERGIPTPGEYRAAHGVTSYDTSRCCQIWQRATIRRILTDERYTGTYVMGKREVTEISGTHMRLKDESEWIKIPNHHPAIVSRELFEQVQAQLLHFKCVKRNTHLYPLRGKVICGCCRHAMHRTAAKKHLFICNYTRVNENALCHGLQIAESDLETMLYEILSRQAQIILNLSSLTDVGSLDIQLAKQTEYDRQIESCLEQKRMLYEQFILREVSAETYQSEKSRMNSELDRLKQVHAALAAQTGQMQMDEEVRGARRKLAQEITETDSLTAKLADTLIERVYVYPDNQVEIVWKMKDFCVGE